MALPGNGIFVVRGEMSTLMTAMPRSSRWNSTAYMDEEKDGLMKMFMDLKQILYSIEDLRLIDPNVYLHPFLEVIRTDETTGAVTSLALAAINKFLSYGLLDPTSVNLAHTVDHIVDVVTHARFMGTDQSSDVVTLFRVVEVLNTLMRSPEGSMLSNAAVCDVMLSCFKICFEPRLNELLRRSADQALKDMVLLLFMRLPQFSADVNETGWMKKFQMMSNVTATRQKDKKHKLHKNQTAKNAASDLQRSQSFKSNSDLNTISMTDMVGVNAVNDEEKTTVISPTNENITTVEQHKKSSTLNTTSVTTPDGSIVDLQSKTTHRPHPSASITSDITRKLVEQESTDVNAVSTTPMAAKTLSNLYGESPSSAGQSNADSSEYINSVGVRFTQKNLPNDGADVLTPPTPYGLSCIQELFHFLILLCNPLDKQNTDIMIHMGLSLLTIAFEVGADNIGEYENLLHLVKDELCRYLLALLNTDRLKIFAADLQLCFLLFESLRGHLKFQLEAYLKKLADIITGDNPKTPHEMRELALDNLLQLWRLPGFVTELYINYDCDLYCTDLLENLTNLLSKYTLSATNVVYSSHLIGLDTLITVVDNIERNCLIAKSGNSKLIEQQQQQQQLQQQQSSNNASGVPMNRHSRHNSGLEGIIIEEPGASLIVEECKIENISKFINSSSRLRLLTNPGNNATINALSREYLADVKNKKRILTQGTELFNHRPEKGIQYLQENSILNTVLDAKEVALFLRENPGLDKKMIGEYISKKKNVDDGILLEFVNSFDFSNLRIDQALRLYLETFRLPGESPLIFLVLEQFAERWHKQNDEPFANTDAAFSLAYAIIMLNMDQHNSTAKRLNVPMTQDDFLKNLRGLNNGDDFDQEMLSQIFHAIKNEEIIMPAEQTGLVRENYLWKVLLRRGLGVDGVFHYVNDATFDLEIFKIIWGPFLSALSFMFDKSNENGYQRAVKGFSKCAAILAYFDLHEDFDALALTLCKFTTLLNSGKQQDGGTTTATVSNDLMLAINFGLNAKAQAAMRTVFSLVHNYGDCLREGWHQILDLYLQLFRLKLLPKTLIEVEDFCEASGKAQLILEKPMPKQESGLLSSLYSYLSSEGQREPTYEEQEIIKIGKKCIRECQLDQMIQESKFLQLESLQELLNCVLKFLKPPTGHKSIGMPYAEDVVVFWMEFLVRIVIYNRDRMVPLWAAVCNHMYLLLMGAASCGYDYLLNRCIVAMLKLAIYLMRNEELCPIVLKSLRILLMLKPMVILRISRQISIGMYELLKTSAQNIHSEQDWQIVFTLLECVGAGALPSDYDDTSLPLPNNNGSYTGAKSDGGLSSEDDSGMADRGYTSDSELAGKQSLPHQIPQLQQNVNSNTSSPYASSPANENWILVNKDIDLNICSRPQSPPTPLQAPSLTTLAYNCKLLEHSPFALFKCWESLTFVVRNVAHITPYNFESCVRCLRTYVEACRDGGIKQRRKYAMHAANSTASVNDGGNKRKLKRHERTLADRIALDEQDVTAQLNSSHSPHSDGAASDADANNAADLMQRYETLAIQLLDLMYTLYTRTAQIFRWWAEGGCTVPQCSSLWTQGWCPLLLGIARLAMDRRREVRTYAISCLQQRALLVQDLQTLTGSEWASCFQLILFPLLNELLPESPTVTNLDAVLLEESRIRTATIMSKVFLHHLSPLIELGNAFNDLWLQILDYIEKFLNVGSDMLSEQMQEILKNMLLVMHSVRVFHHPEGNLRQPLWYITWQRIGEFLPELRDELFRNEGDRTQMISVNNTSDNRNDKKLISGVSEFTMVTSNPLLTQDAVTLANEAGVQQNLSTPPQSLAAGSPLHNSVSLLPPIADTQQHQPTILEQTADMEILGNMPAILPQSTIMNSNTIAKSTAAALATTEPVIISTNSTLSTITNRTSTIPQAMTAITTPASNANSFVNVPASIEALLAANRVKQTAHTNRQIPAATTTLQNTAGNTITETPTPALDHRSPFLVSCLNENDLLTPINQSFSIELPKIALEHNRLCRNSNTTHTTDDALKSPPPLSDQMRQEHNQASQLYDDNHLKRKQLANTQYPNATIPAATMNNTSSSSSQLNTTIFLGDNVNSLSESNLEYTDGNPHNAGVDEGNLKDFVPEVSKADTHSTNVPISHLLSIDNVYPSLNKQPNAAIVNSFAPVYAQNAAVTIASRTGIDIYQEYVQNPYNLTLDQNHLLEMHDNKPPSLEQPQAREYQPEQQQQQQEQLVQGSQPHLQVTQTPANYFSNIIDPNSIPPGSEMLFSQP